MRMAGRGWGLEVSATNTAPRLGVLRASCFRYRKGHEPLDNVIIYKPCRRPPVTASPTRSAPPFWRMSSRLARCGMRARLSTGSGSRDSLPGSAMSRSRGCAALSRGHSQVDSVIASFNYQCLCCRGAWTCRGDQCCEQFLQQDQPLLCPLTLPGGGAALAWQTWTVLPDQGEAVKSLIFGWKDNFSPRRVRRVAVSVRPCPWTRGAGRWTATRWC